MWRFTLNRHLRIYILSICPLSKTNSYINCIQRFHTFSSLSLLELNLSTLFFPFFHIFLFIFRFSLSRFLLFCFISLSFSSFFFLLFSFSVKSLIVEMTTGVAVSSCGNVCFATLAAVTENCLLVSVTFSNVSFMFPSCSLSFTLFPFVCIAFRFSFLTEIL